MVLRSDYVYINTTFSYTVRCLVLCGYVNYSRNQDSADSLQFNIQEMTMVLQKYKYYRAIGVEPLEALLWAGEDRLYASRL